MRSSTYLLAPWLPASLIYIHYLLPQSISQDGISWDSLIHCRDWYRNLQGAVAPI